MHKCSFCLHNRVQMNEKVFIKIFNILGTHFTQVLKCWYCSWYLMLISHERVKAVMELYPTPIWQSLIIMMYLSWWNLGVELPYLLEKNLWLGTNYMVKLIFPKAWKYRVGVDQEVASHLKPLQLQHAERQLLMLA